MLQTRLGEAVFDAISRAFTYPDQHVRGLAYRICSVSRQGIERYGLAQNQTILRHVEQFLMKVVMKSGMGTTERKLTARQIDHCLSVVAVVFMSGGTFDLSEDN